MGVGGSKIFVPDLFLYLNGWPWKCKIIFFMCTQQSNLCTSAFFLLPLNHCLPLLHLECFYLIAITSYPDKGYDALST